MNVEHPGSDLRPPPDPSRIVFTDPPTGILTRDGFYFLLSLFKAAVRAEGTAILEAIDSGSEITVIPGLQDFAAKVAALAEATPGITKAQLEEIAKLLYLDAPAGVTLRQLEEVRRFLDGDQGCDCCRRISELEKLIAAGGYESPAAAAAAPLVTNGGGGQALNPDGTAPGTPVAPGTPGVPALPTPGGGGLATPGQVVIFNGQPWIYKNDPAGGPTGYWSLDVTAAPTIRDVFANLHLYSASSYPIGTVFFATDWLVSYAVQQPAGGKAWLYYNGIYSNTLANIPGTLGTNDTGFTFKATDYLHNWMWNGAAWHFTTGGIAAGSLFFSTTGPPFGGAGALWHLLDGSTQNISQDNGTVTATLLPTVANEYIAR